MQHLDDGALRAHVDGQLDQDGARHLERCSECRARLAEIVNRSSLIQTRLRALDAQGREPTSAGAAWRRFQNEYQKKETSMWTSLRTRLRPLLARLRRWVTPSCSRPLLHRGISSVTTLSAAVRSKLA